MTETDAPSAESAVDQVDTGGEVQESTESADTEAAGQETEGTDEQSAEKSEAEYWQEMLESRPITVKVGGKERQVKTFDELKKYTSLGNAAYEEIGAARKLQEEAQRREEELKNLGLVDFLKMRGLEGEGILEEIAKSVQALQEEEEMDPRDRRLREYERQEAERKAEADKAAKDAEEKAYAAEVEKIQQQLMAEVDQAIEASTLPKTPFLMRQVFAEMQMAAEAGTEMSSQEAVRIVQDNFYGDYAANLREVEDLAVVEKILGEDKIKALRKKWTQEAKSAEEPLSNSRKSERQASWRKIPSAAEDGDVDKGNKPKSMNDFFNDLRRGRA